jgi:succinyl-diaminopimelate desuccinylase
VTGSDLAARLLERTHELVAIPSESRSEHDVLAYIRSAMRSDRWSRRDEGDGVLFFTDSAEPKGRPTIVLAGHVDTVPRGRSPNPAVEDRAVVGRGAADMKGGVAVMLELADALGRNDVATDLDVALLFFGREELPFRESALMPFLARSERARAADLAVVLEPTSNAIEAGCLGNLNVRVVVRGTAAHSARPWLGDNAIHQAIAALGSVVDVPVQDVEVDGYEFRESLSVTTIEGGTAGNVVPDLVTAHVNFRYAPHHTPEEAESRLRELLGHRRLELEILGNAPPGRVPVGNPLVDRLRDAVELPIGPKQAWTPVAEFGVVGVDAINLGPGDPRYAHTDDERVEVSSLVRSFEVLFLARGAGTKEPIP